MKHSPKSNYIKKHLSSYIKFQLSQGYSEFDIKKVLKDFGYKDEYLLQMFTPDKDLGHLYLNGQHAVDAAHMFTQIKGRNHRTAIKKHVARSRMNVEQIHDFINLEYNKIRTENKKLRNTPYLRAFAAFDGKWIAEGIQMIVPKMTHDLVEEQIGNWR